jgi:hypothetical protein
MPKRTAAPPPTSRIYGPSPVHQTFIVAVPWLPCRRSVPTYPVSQSSGTSSVGALPSPGNPLAAQARIGGDGDLSLRPGSERLIPGDEPSRVAALGRQASAAADKPQRITHEEPVTNPDLGTGTKPRPCRRTANRRGPCRRQATPRCRPTAGEEPLPAPASVGFPGAQARARTAVQPEYLRPRGDATLMRAAQQRDRAAHPGVHSSGEVDRDARVRRSRRLCPPIRASSAPAVLSACPGQAFRAIADTH